MLHAAIGFVAGAGAAMAISALRTTRTPTADRGEGIAFSDLSTEGQWFGLQAVTDAVTGKIHLIDAGTGNRISSDNYLTVDRSGFHCGRLVASDGRGYGFVNANGEWAVLPRYDHADRISCGLAKVVVGGKIGYIDIAGDIKIPLKYDWGSRFIDGFAVVGTLTLRGRIESMVADRSSSMEYMAIDLTGTRVEGRLADSLIRRFIP